MDVPFPQTDLFSGSMLNFGGVSSENRWFNKWHLAGTFFERLLQKPTNVGVSTDFGYFRMLYAIPIFKGLRLLISSEGLTWDPRKKCQVMTGGFASLEWGRKPCVGHLGFPYTSHWSTTTKATNPLEERPISERARESRSNQKMMPSQGIWTSNFTSFKIHIGLTKKTALDNYTPEKSHIWIPNISQKIMVFDMHLLSHLCPISGGYKYQSSPATVQIAWLQFMGRLFQLMMDSKAMDLSSLWVQKLFLVGGWTNPFEKYARQIGNLPQVGVKRNNLWVATT